MRTSFCCFLKWFSFINLWFGFNFTHLKWIKVQKLPKLIQGPPSNSEFFKTLWTCDTQMLKYSKDTFSDWSRPISSPRTIIKIERNGSRTLEQSQNQFQLWILSNITWQTHQIEYRHCDPKSIIPFGNLANSNRYI